jgi:hypothetical protein
LDEVLVEQMAVTMAALMAVLLVVMTVALMGYYWALKLVVLMVEKLVHY